MPEIHKYTHTHTQENKKLNCFKRMVQLYEDGVNVMEKGRSEEREKAEREINTGFTQILPLYKANDREMPQRMESCSCSGLLGNSHASSVKTEVI